MSDNITKEARLTALVLSAPPECPTPGDHYCALYRAAVASGADVGATLSGFAQTLGFSVREAWGIMRGWDIADGGHSNVRGGPGFDLGARLHALVHGTKEVS